MSTAETNSRRRLNWWEVRQLEENGCRSRNWDDIRISDHTSLDKIRNVAFEGSVTIGSLSADSDNGLENVRIIDCSIGNEVSIRNIGVHIKNCIIGDTVKILDTSLIEFEQEASCGMGTEVDVLDETGSRHVIIYPGLSAQTAMLMAREPKWRERHLDPIIDELKGMNVPAPVIGADTLIAGCGLLRNVHIGREIRIEGAENLRNGMVLNNAAPGRGITFIGGGVNAENFILEDGVLDSGVIVRNCYIGQGATLEKGFTAHDSLFFANCSLENGEACALFAGPYTVSMHKSTLLIGCLTSFLNAGSGTNQSNHMYKLGPVHWGILERGVKTGSGAYLMLGAKIGAFSLLMGQHKTHPDSSQFPFSYLFGDDKGATVVVPGVMLRSCGLLRDEQKWPNRDKRLKRKLPLHDRIIFNVLNPLTVEQMLTAIEVIETLLQKPADDDFYIRYKGMKFTRAALERAKNLYSIAIYKYLSLHIDEINWGKETGESKIEEWVDLGGLPVTRTTVAEAMAAESISEMENIFDAAYSNYTTLERNWIESRFPERWHRDKGVISDYAAEFDRMVEEDRNRYLEELQAENEMLKL